MMPQPPHRFDVSSGALLVERKQSNCGVVHGGVRAMVRYETIAHPPSSSPACRTPAPARGGTRATARTSAAEAGFTSRRMRRASRWRRSRASACLGGEIAKVVGICGTTLAKHYGETLDIAATKANSLVAQSLFNRAVKGDGAAATSAAIFWLKVRAGWREKDVHEVTGPNGGPIQMVDMSGLSDAQLAALRARARQSCDALDRGSMMRAHEETAWPADRVERRAVASLVPYARNSRTHSPEQVDQIAASIREWGWTVPVLVDEDGGLIAGHARVMAAKQLGLAEVPVMVAAGWSEAQKRAYVIADNKLALNAGWDDALLKIELTELQALDFDLGMTGFSLDEIATLTMDGVGRADRSRRRARAAGRPGQPLG